jgi:hypothetical protein
MELSTLNKNNRMGFEFIAAKSKKYTHRRNEKFAERMKSKNIFSGVGEETVHQFRCKAVGDTLPEVGMGVLLFQSGEKINVLLQNKQVGTVMSPDSKELKNLLKQMRTEATAAGVVEVRKAAKIFLIQL